MLAAERSWIVLKWSFRDEHKLEDLIYESQMFGFLLGTSDFFNRNTKKYKLAQDSFLAFDIPCFWCLIARLMQAKRGN